MEERDLREMIQPKQLDGIAAAIAAEHVGMGKVKVKGERDTEFVKRIVCAYLNALPEASDLYRRLLATVARAEDAKP